MAMMDKRKEGIGVPGMVGVDRLGHKYG